MEQGLRAVVLGWQKSDKASVINRLLGDEVESDKHFVKSVRRDGDVNGRKITLINTPCWWQIFGLQDSPEVVKQELVCSVFKCPPGPHVFLLVINLSLPFTEENRLSIEKHFSLFGERIWRHTIVTRADSLKDKNIEQHIKNQDLQQIIQRCGQRYHIFENENKSAAVQELLDKIDNVVAANNGKHFETHDDMLLEIKRKRDENEDKAKARQKMLQDKRKLLKELTGALFSETRIVLLGWILSGKSSTIHTIFNNEKVKTEGTEKCPKYSSKVNDRKITVLDTPGWWKYFSCKFNPKFAQAAILESISQSQHMQFPHAMILVIPIDTAFNIEQKKIIEEYMAILGEEVWRHTIVLFTWGDRFTDISIEQHIESEGDALQWLIEKCRNRYHIFDNTDKKNRDQVTELLQKIDEMAAENSLFRFNIPKYSDPEKSLQRAEHTRKHKRKKKDKQGTIKNPDNVQAQITELLQKIDEMAAQISLFSLHTQCAAEVPVPDKEIILNADHVEKLINQELNNRCNAIKKKLKLELLGMNFPGCRDEESDAGIEVESDSSMLDTPDLSADEKLKELIRREGSRWETIIMDGLSNILQNPDGNTRQSSNEMVKMWLQKSEEHSASKTSNMKLAQ
ncbi:GTPase IMAP family member 8-like isoform X2 [Megalobrama amblycephala]|uniref:GTPase IMAP family member 8-like isoform X2 n=1 Tax=Megalobrama amblycephala TaxID=75352 RepID=UPI0020141087|nr:GTPase IMAP family member 8-like isoform X2 [Megalobrama amblycephala]